MRTNESTEIPSGDRFRRDWPFLARSIPAMAEIPAASAVGARAQTDEAGSSKGILRHQRVRSTSGTNYALPISDPVKATSVSIASTTDRFLAVSTRRTPSGASSQACQWRPNRRAKPL